jgi:hypothetical protein
MQNWQRSDACAEYIFAPISATNLQKNPKFTLEIPNHSHAKAQ